MESLEFFFDGYSVGTFFQLPKAERNYEFEPFRGKGHYEMATAIQSQGYTDCYYYHADKKCYFKVAYEDTFIKTLNYSLKVTELTCFLI